MSKNQQIEFAKINRVEVIDSEGRSFTQHYKGKGVLVMVQDKGRTLKIFAGVPNPDPGVPAWDLPEKLPLDKR